jgi:Putative adhesin
MTTVSISGSPTSGLAVPRRSRGARVGWTVAGLILAAAAVITAVLGTVTDVAYQKVPHEHRTFTASVAAVSIDVGHGSVTVERSSGTQTDVESWGTRGLSFPTDNEAVSGGTLDIRSHCGSALVSNNCSRNYIVHVRPAVTVTVTTGEGDVAATAMNGPVSLHTGEGDVSVTRDVGPLQATTGEGNISVADLRTQSVTVASGEGDVELGLVSQPMHVAASSSEGDVTVKLPRGSASYQVHASSGEGLVSNTVNQNSASRRRIRATSSEGDVTVRYSGH